jgi:hypothetical protein
MNVKHKYSLIIGIVVLIVGLVATMDYFGVISIPIPGLTNSIASPSGTVELSVPIYRIQYPLTLSTVSTGYTYKWSSPLTNTGTVDWTDSWINVRLGIAGATAATVTCASNPSSCSSGTVGGSFYVDQCSSGTDVQACRLDLTTWTFKWSPDGTTWNTGCTGTYPGALKSAGASLYVCSVDIGPVTHGASAKPIYWQLTVPAGTANGNYPFIVQGMAYASASYSLGTTGGSYDTLTVGTVSGSLALAFVGFISIIGGFALLGYAFV